jgi:hypothetical protein
MGKYTRDSVDAETTDEPVASVQAETAKTDGGKKKKGRKKPAQSKTASKAVSRPDKRMAAQIPALSFDKQKLAPDLPSTEGWWNLEFRNRADRLNIIEDHAIQQLFVKHRGASHFPSHQAACPLIFCSMGTGAALTQSEVVKLRYFPFQIARSRSPGPRSCTSTLTVRARRGG